MCRCLCLDIFWISPSSSWYFLYDAGRQREREQVLNKAGSQTHSGNENEKRNISGGSWFLGGGSRKKIETGGIWDGDGGLG